MRPIAFIAFSATVAAPALADQTTTAPAVATAEQRAADDAFQKLVDEIMDLPLAGNHTVAGLLGIVPHAEIWLRTTLLTKRQNGQARRESGNMEVDNWIPMPQIAELLRDLVGKYMPMADPSIAELKPSNRSTAFATGVAADHPVNATAPVGWRHCSEHQLAMVRAAAQIDFRRTFMDRLAQWNLSPQETVGDLWDRFPGFFRQVQRRVEAIHPGDPVFEAAGTCRYSMKLSRQDLVNLLVKAADDTDENIESDLTRAVDPEYNDPLVLDGLAVAPPSAAPVEISSPEWSADHRPPWFNEILNVKVTGRPPSSSTAREERRQMAVNLARLEAKRQLWLQVESLKLPGGGTVGGIIEQSPRRAQIVTAIENAMQPTHVPVFDEQDIATVSISIQLDTVWRMLRSER